MAVDDGIIEAGRAIRPYLQELVGSKVAPELDGRIAALLSAAGADEVPGSLRALLGEREETAAFLEAVLADAPQFRPPQVRRADARGWALRDMTVGFEAPAGDIQPVGHAARFVCPHGDFAWYRPALGTPLPPCPTHGPGLIRG